MLTAIALLLTMRSLPTEVVVAGGAKDLMIVRHVRVMGTNQSIGRQLAEIARKNHGVTAGTVDPKQQEVRLAWARTHYPEWYERSRGVASAFGVRDASKETLSLSYNLDVAPGCSVVFYPGSSVEGGHSMLSRNYDFPTGTYAEITGAPKPAKARSMTGDPYVLEVVPDKGFASLYVASYDLLGGCIDGINEKGLAVALLADDVSPRQAPPSSDGVNEISLTRYLLDRCTTAEEARKELKSLAFHYTFTPCHYMVCDPSGDSFVWEISPDLKRRFVVEGNRKPQIVTNHLLSSFKSADLHEGNSFDRYKRLQEELAKGKSYTPDQVTTNNLCVAVPTNPSHATLWHSVYDLTDHSMRVSFYLGLDGHGEARRTPYLAFKLRR